MEIKADAAQAAQSFLRVAVESERARLILELAEKARRSIGGGWEELSKRESRPALWKRRALARRARRQDMVRLSRRENWGLL